MDECSCSVCGMQLVDGPEQDNVKIADEVYACWECAELYTGCGRLEKSKEAARNCTCKICSGLTSE